MAHLKNQMKVRNNFFVAAVLNFSAQVKISVARKNLKYC